MAHQCTLYRVATLISLLAHRVWSWIPPHPDGREGWESVHDMRRRLKRNFNYTTSKYVDAEMCRFLTEEQCEESDHMMQEHIKAHKNLQTQVRANPNLGTINVLVLMVRFTDHVDRDLIPKRDIDEFWQTRVPEWLDVNSQGRYDIKATVINWITTDNTEEYYSFGQRGTVREAQQMAWPALDNLDSRPNWDWSQYDLDGNGQIDSLVIIHSGYGAETIQEDCFGADFNNRIWAHAFSAGSRDTWRSKDGAVRVNGYTIASAFDGYCGTVPAKIGLTVHEYMHTLGLVDLYDGVDPLAASGIGSFDIMAVPYGQNGDADNPGHLSIYSKILAEWAEPKEISAAGEFTLKASEISDEAYRITLADYGFIAEYLLIENRQPLEFDINIWDGGLVIYHIDDAANLQMNLGYPGQPGWPENGNHYQVALLPKDGDYDLEKGENDGDAGDMWLPGDTLGPGNGGTVYPNTDLYGSGFIQETGIWLAVLSQTGTDVTFQVGGFDGEDAMQVTTPSPTAGTASPTKAPTGAPTIRPTQSPTVAPTVGAPNPTQVPTAETSAPTGTTPSPTQLPTIGTPRPTRAATQATVSPTQPPSQVFTTFAPTIETTTSTPTTTPPTPPPTTLLPTASPTKAESSGPIPPSTPLPFGSYDVTRTPTWQPISSDSYLSSFQPYLGRPTPLPKPTPQLSPLDLLSPVTAATPPENTLTPPSLDDVESSPSNPTRPYLSNFGSALEVQLGPPQEKDGEASKIFLSSAFGRHTSEEENDLFTDGLDGTTFDSGVVQGMDAQSSAPPNQECVSLIVSFWCSTLLFAIL